MPNFADVINNFGCGNDLAIQRTVTNIPNNETIIVAWFYVKRELSDLDSAAIITKRITATTTPLGQITNATAGGDPAVVVFVLNENDTALLSQPNWFEIRVETNDTRQYTSNRGVIRGQSSVMNSVS